MKKKYFLEVEVYEDFDKLMEEELMEEITHICTDYYCYNAEIMKVGE